MFMNFQIMAHRLVRISMKINIGKSPSNNFSFILVNTYILNLNQQTSFISH